MRDARRLALTTILTLALILAPAFRAAAGPGLIRDAEIEHTLARMLDPLLVAAGLPKDSVRLFIFDERAPNAFVSGDRHMGVTTGLIRKAKTPDELIAVLAHETGHITGGDATQRRIALSNAEGPAVIGMLLAIAAGLAGGPDAGAALAVGSQQAVNRMLLAYSRGEEAAADQAAITYMEKVGVDTKGMIDMLSYFRGQDIFSSSQQDPYVRTHPLSSERMALAERRCKASPTYGKGPDPDLNYWYQRTRAKLEAWIDPPARVLQRIDPNDDSELAIYKRAIALHRLPDPTSALAEADKLIKKRPNDPYYWELKGQILLENGRGPDAVAPYRKAVSLAPNEPLIRGYLGRALMSVGTKEANREALKALEEGARDSAGGDSFLLRDLAFAYAKNGQEGMAALATAERMAISGHMRDASRNAKQARQLLPKGSPAWLRADDIISVAKAAE